MLSESPFLIPCDGFLALLTCLDVHSSFGEEGILTIVISLLLSRPRVTVFHLRVRIAIAGFPVLTRTHVIHESRAEQLSPVYLFFTLFEIELNIIGVSQRLIALFNLVFLSTKPPFAICPEGIACLKVLRIHFLLQYLQLLQLGRVEHFHVVLVVR